MAPILTSSSEARGPRRRPGIPGTAIAMAAMIVGVALLRVDSRSVPLRPIVYSRPAPTAPTVTASPGGRPATTSASGSAAVIATVVLRARHTRQGGQRRRDARVDRLDAARPGG